MSKKFSLNDPNDQSTVKTNLIVDEAENKYHIENYQDQSSVKEILVFGSIWTFAFDLRKPINWPGPPPIKLFERLNKKTTPANITIGKKKLPIVLNRAS